MTITFLGLPLPQGPLCDLSDTLSLILVRRRSSEFQNFSLPNCNGNVTAILLNEMQPLEMRVIDSLCEQQIPVQHGTVRTPSHVV